MELVANACSAVVAFYAVRLREALPDVAPPALHRFPELWQVRPGAQDP